MAVSPLYRSNPVRMMGMASGMDTQSIIDATLRMHKFKIEQQMRNRQVIEWKQKMHNDIKDQITSLKNTYLSNLGSKTMMNRNVFNTNLATATVAGGAKSTAVSVSATVNAGIGSLTIDKITQLAQNSTISSSSPVSNSGDGFTTGTQLKDLVFAGNSTINFSNYQANAVSKSGATVTLNQSDLSGLTWKEQSTLNVNGKEIVVTRDGGGAIKFEVDGSEVAATLNADGKYEIDLDGTDEADLLFSYDGTNLSFAFASKPDETNEMTFYQRTVISKDGEEVVLTKNNSSVPDDIGGGIKNGDNGGSLNWVGETKINVNGNDITLRSNMTITDMLNKVNTEVPGVTMSYDRMQDRFTITNKNNADPAVTVRDVAGGNIVTNLFGSDDITGSVSQMAEVYINGSDEPLRFDSNNFSYRGVTFRLHETTNEQITVNVTRDTDKAVDAIKDFINSYNSLISKLEGLLSERKTSQEASYTALTDEEKSTMTEKQIEEWEAIAKKGILRNDRTIENLVSSLRSTFFQQIEGTGLSASQIGLTTGSYFDGTGGQIQINEDRLRAALEEDPDRVADVFIKIDNSNGLKGQGLMHKINDILTDFTKLEGSQDITLKALEKSYADMNARIAKLEERMWAEEDKLYRQFAAMETALSKMQQQGDWFSAMLGA